MRVHSLFECQVEQTVHAFEDHGRFGGFDFTPYFAQAEEDYYNQFIPTEKAGAL